jgi:Rrf2 family protein
MIRISTKGRYGSRFMLELAVHYGDKPLLLKEIARRQDISEGYLQHIVDALKGAGLVVSSRVGHGGYALAKPPDQITLRDVLSTLEGSIDLVECVENPDICTRAADCTLRDVWRDVSHKFAGSLQGITLQQMVEQKRERQNAALLYEI